MLIVQKIFEAFLLPPGIFVTLCLVLAICWARSDRKKAFTVFLIAVLLYLLSTGVGVFLFLRPLEQAYKPGIIEGTNAVVVLGGGVVKSPQGYEPSIHSTARLVAGIQLASAHNLSLILTGGTPPGVDQVPEAEIMKRFAVKFGIDEDKIIVEPQAKTTLENAINTAGICREYQFKKLVLVTSAVHMKRAVFSFKKAGVSVVPYPTGYLYDYSQMKWIDIIPNKGAAEANLSAIHEWFGLLWYWLKTAF